MNVDEHEFPQSIIDHAASGELELVWQDGSMARLPHALLRARCRCAACEQQLRRSAKPLLSTGTGLAPFISVIQDPETYERFEKVVLVHGVRQVDELAYAQFIEHQLPAHEFLGDLLRDKLVYYPTVTREAFRNQGRLTELIESGKLAADIGLPTIDPATDRVMICGSTAMLEDSCKLLDARGFHISPRQGELGDYVIERAFVEK
jgi:ferredoxin--NADP+ reductase